MNQRQRFIRKIVYACVIAALLLPLSWLSQPETTESKGGRLAQMRSDYHLGQAQLGDIDPASETIKLATLGMRGVAANLLWDKANEYHKNEDWVNLSATLEQISKLQPNFVSVWIFQGWNLSYNISVEFDDYHDRYYWVIKGIEFLKEGTQYNKDDPRLLSRIGWTVANKIGRSDEHEQFRRLFREDDDFNGAIPRAQRDNWLVGREWMLEAQKAVSKGVPIRGEAPILFYSHPVMCLMDYSEALAEEGIFGEVAKNAWRRAHQSWIDYSNRDLPSQYNVFFRLSEKESYDEQSKQAQEELAKLTPPGLREKLKEERLATLNSEERAVYEMPTENRTREQQQVAYGIDAKLQLSHLDIASRIEGENKTLALQAAEQAAFADQMASMIDVERDVVNYGYWLQRSEIEPNDATLAARKLTHDADQAAKSVQLLSASQKYAEGMEKWHIVFQTYPQLLNDPTFVEEIWEIILRYRKAVDQLDEEFPNPFVLQYVLDAYTRLHSAGPKPPQNTTPSADPTKPPGEPAATNKPSADDAQAAEPKP